MKIVLGVFLLLAAAAPAWAAGDPARGKMLYAACQQCHSLDENGVGPRHRGVFGRKAGTQPGYDYSAALKARGLTWNEVTLDAWLRNPAEFVPGSKMTYYLYEAQDRADVIAYLKSQAP